MGRGELLDAMRATVSRYRMVAPGEKVVVAVSGGPDSLALLHGLRTLRDELGITLHAAHLNHLLRGDAARADAEYVRALAAEMGLPVTVEEVAVADLARGRGLSIEEAGREARYAFYQRVREAAGAARVALGHTADDQAETVLMRLLRGAGPAGLAGIPPVRDGWIVRPLIAVTRRMVEDYCRAVGLEPCRDESNRDPAHLRNRVRWDLLPRLEREYNPALRRALVHLADVLREEDAWLAGLVAGEYGRLAREDVNGIRLALKDWENRPLALRRRLVREAAARLLGRPAPLEFGHVEAVLGLTGAPVGSRLDLPGGLVARREYAHVHIGGSQAPGGVAAGGFSYPLPVPGRVAVPEAGLILEADLRPAGAEVDKDPAPAGPGRFAVHLDADRCVLPLTVRSRRQGDRFWPAGLGAAKKLKDFFISAKVPREERDRIPLVTGGDGSILWVVGRRADDRFLPTSESRRLLTLRAHPAGVSPTR